MNEKTKGVIYFVLFVIVLAGISIFLNYQNSTHKEVSLIKDVEDVVSKSEVLEVTENTFDTEVLKSDKKVLVDFYAKWCGPCKTIKPRIDAVATEHPEIKIVSIDVDKSPNLSDKYGIYSIPTLVVIENGSETNRAVGAIEKEKIVEILGIK